MQLLHTVFTVICSLLIDHWGFVSLCAAAWDFSLLSHSLWYTCPDNSLLDNSLSPKKKSTTYQGSSYGGRRRAGPPTTHDFRPAIFLFFLFFFLVPGTMFHNRGSIIAQCTCVIHWKWPCQALNSRRGIAPGPPVVGAALHWHHSLRLPLLFTIIFHHSDWAS